MPTYYLNPVVIVLSDLVFKKVDLEPGSGQFVNTDFLIQDFGSMTSLSITVDRTIAGGRVVYYTDANNLATYSNGAKFYCSDTASLPSYVSLNNRDGRFHSNFVDVDGNGDRVVDSANDLLRGAIFSIIVDELFEGVDTGQINFTGSIARESGIFFDYDSTDNILDDIISKTQVEFNRDVNGGAEVEYWNAFTGHNTVPEELSYVPFQEGDKLYVAYTLSSNFQVPDTIPSLSGLSVDQSNVSTKDPFTNRTITVSFVLGWNLTYPGGNGAIDNMGGPLENMTVTAYKVDENGTVSTKPLMPPLVSDNRGRTLIPSSWNLSDNDKFVCHSTNERGDQKIQH